MGQLRSLGSHAQTASLEAQPRAGVESSEAAALSALGDAAATEADDRFKQPAPLANARVTLSAPAATEVPKLSIAAAIFMSDEALAALTIEQKIAVASGFITLLDSSTNSEHEERQAAQKSLAALIKSTFKTPHDFDRLVHSVNARALYRHSPGAKKIQAQFLSNLRATIPGDWAAYSRHLDTVTGTVATAGNKVELMSDGQQVMNRMHADVAAAKSSIDISMYKWEPDSVGMALADELIVKATSKPPVRVRVMLDQQGSFDEDPEGLKAMISRMRVAGIEVIVKKPGLLRDHLDHRKVIVIDGTIGYAGGMNIGLVYRDTWRDQLSRIEGSVVNQLRISMRERWRQEGGALSDDDNALQPTPGVCSGEEMRVITHAGNFADSYIKAAYLKALYTAERTINVANPYHTDPDIRRALIDASARGVRVRVMTPEDNDVPLLRDAARAGYPELIAAGVEVYEYQGRMAHQKVATIDGTWSTFGSSNLDARSLDYNEELNVFSTAAQVARDIDEQMFEPDLLSSKRITSYRPSMKEKVFKAFSGLM